MTKKFAMSVFSCSVLALATSGAHAALAGSAGISLVSTDTSGAQPVYSYSITLNDTGTTTVGTFWYAWLPGEDFMRVSPTNIVTPAGWQSLVTGGNPNNGFAIQWKASTAASNIPSGGSLTFGFSSTDDLAYLSGNSQFYATTPVLTSELYSGAPFSDAGFVFQVAVVPEPALAMPLAAPAALLLARRRRR